MKKVGFKYLFHTLVFFLFATLLLSSCGDEEKEEEEVWNLPDINISFISDSDSLLIAKKAAEIDKKFIRLQKLTGFNGTVLYAEKGRVVFKKAYGFKNVRRKRDSLSTKDAFQLASVSKMFSAMAVMILKNDGQLNYDDDIRLYLPEFPYDGVTPRLLMTHRAGLPRYMSLAHDKWTNKKMPFNNDQMLQLFVDSPPNKYFAPDNGFHYCNIHYCCAVLSKICHLLLEICRIQISWRTFYDLKLHHKQPGGIYSYHQFSSCLMHSPTVITIATANI